MSTGDVRRPSLNKLSAKAAATDKPDPDVIDDESASSSPVKPASARKGTPAAASKKAASARARTRSSDVDEDDDAPATKTPAKTATKARTTTTPAKRTPAKAGGGGRGPAGRPGGGGGGKGRKPSGPIRVRQGVNWGPVAMYTAAGVIAVLIIGFLGYKVYEQDHQKPWKDRAAAIPGIHNYLQTNPDWFVVPAEGNHKQGVLEYPTSPAVGGTHNPRWQSCMGDVYTEPIAKEHAVHSLEHGAVWIAYRPDLPKDQVNELADKVRDKPFMMMAPYPGLDVPISLQAWGYQLKVDNAGDGRIDDFIDALRQNATQEPQVGCSEGITDTSDTPLNFGD